MWTDYTTEIKEFFNKHQEEITKYETDYFPEKGMKRWTIFIGKQQTVFEQEFDFSFFKK